MPVAVDENVQALETVRDALGRFQETGAHEHDLAFLAEILDSHIVSKVVQAQETLEMDEPPAPLSQDTVALVKEVMADCQDLEGVDGDVDELVAIFADPYVRSLVETTDDVANHRFYPLSDPSPEAEEGSYADDDPFPPAYNPPSPVGQEAADLRVVGIRKLPNEPLGLTVQEDVDGPYPKLLISRVMAGGVADTTDLLHVGDVIKEVNGTEVHTPEDLQDAMRMVTGSIALKIIPGYVDQTPSQPVYMKAQFNYNPDKDTLIPCREAGLPFKEGEVLEVLNRDDENWWQARHVGGESNPTGLIPSKRLEERRQAFVKPDLDFTKSKFCGLTIKKKHNVNYKATKSADYDNMDLVVYEEVARLPPFERKTLVLVGPPGVGRRSLKNKFVQYDSTRFGVAVPDTSRTKRPEEVDGRGYRFLSREAMKKGISSGEYLEYGEFDGCYYGTSLAAVHDVIRSGRMAIIDCNPEGAKGLKQQSEFMPLVVFISSPPIEVLKSMYFEARQIDVETRPKTDRDFRSTLAESNRIEEQYKQYFDFHLINDNFDLTFKRLLDAMENLATEAQWVPVSWVY